VLASINNPVEKPWLGFILTTVALAGLYQFDRWFLLSRYEHRRELRAKSSVDFSFEPV
jgi:hypothetical protein